MQLKNSIAFAIIASFAWSVQAREVEEAKVYYCSEALAPVDVKAQGIMVGEYRSHGGALIVDMGSFFVVTKADYNYSISSGSYTGMQTANDMIPTEPKDGTFMSKGVDSQDGKFIMFNNDYSYVWTCK